MPEFVITAHRGNEPADASRVVLRDVAAARREAVRYAGELLIDDADAFQGEEWVVTVTDEAHLVLFTMNIVWTAAPALNQRGKRTG